MRPAFKTMPADVRTLVDEAVAAGRVTRCPPMTFTPPPPPKPQRSSAALSRYGVLGAAAKAAVRPVTLRSA